MEQRTLHHGSLSFTTFGCGPLSDPKAPLVLCLHGFPDNPKTFRYMLPALAEKGFRVLAPTLRGYEPSSQPSDGDYQLSTLARDVVAWLDDLEVEQAHLVGHDWGAGITYAAGAFAPERFLSLSTIAVPHAPRMIQAARSLPSQFLKSWYMLFFQLRGIADWIVARNNWAFIHWLWEKWSPGYNLTEESWQDLCNTFSKPGVQSAMLAYYRQNASPLTMLGLHTTESQRWTTVPVRTLAFTGANDQCIDTRLYERAFHDKDFPHGFQIERIPNAGHFAHLEQPDMIHQLLLDWLQR